MDNKVQKTIGDLYCPTCRNEKSVYISINKTIKFYDCKKGKVFCHVLNFTFKDQKPTIVLFGGDGTHCSARKTKRDYEKEKPSPYLKKFLRESDPSASEPEPKNQKLFHLWYDLVHIPLVDAVNQNFNYILHFQSTLKQHDFLSLQRRY